MCVCRCLPVRFAAWRHPASLTPPRPTSRYAHSWSNAPAARSSRTSRMSTSSCSPHGPPPSTGAPPPDNTSACALPSGHPARPGRAPRLHPGRSTHDETPRPCRVQGRGVLTICADQEPGWPGSWHSGRGTGRTAAERHRAGTPEHPDPPAAVEASSRQGRSARLRRPARPYRPRRPSPQGPARPEPLAVRRFPQIRPRRHPPTAPGGHRRRRCHQIRSCRTYPLRPSCRLAHSGPAHQAPPASLGGPEAPGRPCQGPPYSPEGRPRASRPAAALVGRGDRARRSRPAVHR